MSLLTPGVPSPQERRLFFCRSDRDTPDSRVFGLPTGANTPVRADCRHVSPSIRPVPSCRLTSWVTTDRPRRVGVEFSPELSSGYRRVVVGNSCQEGHGCVRSSQASRGVGDDLGNSDVVVPTDSCIRVPHSVQSRPDLLRRVPLGLPVRVDTKGVSRP